jgi:hypothetical protein
MKQFKICKIAPKTLGICRGVLLDHKNSGDVSSPRATATGGTWVHAPPLETPKKPRDLECLLPLCLPTPAVRVTVTCKNLKIHKAVGFSFFLFGLRIYLFSFWICLLGFAFFSTSLFSAGCSSGRRFSIGNGAASVGAAGGRRIVVGR